MRKRYFPSEYIHPTNAEAKRRLTITLLGHQQLAPIGRSLIHFKPDHVEFCYGAPNVRAVFVNETTVPLDEWLDPDKKFPHRLIGFLGPSGNFLYIIIKKKSLP